MSTFLHSPLDHKNPATVSPYEGPDVSDVDALQSTVRRLVENLARTEYPFPQDLHSVLGLNGAVSEQAILDSLRQLDPSVRRRAVMFMRDMNVQMRDVFFKGAQ